MVGGPMKLAVNQFIMENPRAAIAVGAGLVAVGTTLKLRDIMKAIGVKESDLPAGGMAEVELMEEENPVGFWHRGVTSIYASLAEHKMRGDISLPQMDWKHGLWRVRHHVSGFDTAPFAATETVQGHMVTEISTPVMDKSGTKLV